MMFGGGETQAQTQTVASGVNIQSSCYGGVVPVIYGRTRLTGNLLWYGDFQAIPVQSSGGNGGKGGDSGHGATTYDYKASFIFALGEGTVTDVQNVWASKTKTTFAKSNLSFFNGDLAQAPWGYLASKHSDKALSYSGTAYVSATAYDLGQSAQMPNLSYEVTGVGSGAIGTPDADPGAVIYDVLTNPHYGIGFPAARIPYFGFAFFSDYCLANGLVISAVFDTQSDAAKQLNSIVQSCNAEFVWSGSLLTIVPYGDQTVSANGYTYTAPSAPLFSLTDDDFLSENSQDPVQCSRARPSDQMNSIRFEFLDRSHDYNGSIVEAKNQAAIEAYGLRGAQPEQMHHFCNASAAKMAATLKLQRQSVRNVYSFTVGWRYCLLDPMDIVEITDSSLGLAQQWVRILSLEEDDNGNIRVTAEEYLGGTGHAPLYDFEPGSPYTADYNVAPGDVTDWLIFEPPPAMLAARSKDAPQIMIAACGGANWGGCEVHISLDDSTYKRIGRITAPGRLGTLSANLATSSNVAPTADTTHTLSVDLHLSGGVLHSGTTSAAHADADSYRTLCYVDGELVAYDSATLTGVNTYDLTYLQRGVYGSTVAAHSAGTLFCRLDETVKSFDLPVTPVSYVHVPLYIKLVSYNIYGSALQDISTLTAIPYNPNGAGVYVAPPTGVSFSVGTEQNGDGTWTSFGVIAWTASVDPFFDMYDVQYHLSSGGPWTSFRCGADTTSFRLPRLAPNTAYDVQVRAVRTKGPFYSQWDQALNITSVVKTTAPPAPTALTATPGYRKITLKWTASAENDIAWYEIWEGVTNVLGSATLVGKVNATSYIRDGLGLSDTRYYWIRARDTSGNLSTYLGPGTATTKAVDAGDLTGKIIGSQIDNATITGGNLANNIIDISKIAGGYGLPAYYTGTNSPTTSAGKTALGALGLNVHGSIILWNQDGRLYRYVDSPSGTFWTLAVDGGDLSIGSINTNTIAAGSITTALLAAGAVTAETLFIGDTTNLVLDDMFQDSAYWTLRNPGTSPVIVQYQQATVPPATGNGTNTLGAPTSVLVLTSNIPAGSTSHYGATSTYIPIKQNLNYRASCAALCSGTGVNKNAQILIQWYDAQKNFLSTSNSDGSQIAGSYAPGDKGDDGNTFISATGSAIVNTAQAPVGACYAVLIPCVYGGGSGAVAGTGSGWWFSHVRLERQSVGTLIEDGAITTGHITAAGIDGSVITTGTLTGDRLEANFIDSNVFQTVHGTGQAFIEINGQSHTVGGHVNGPWFRVNDGTRDRVIFGRLQDALGMWIWDASGNPKLVEATLADGSVFYNTLGPNAATSPVSARMSGSVAGTGNTNWHDLIPTTTVTLSDAGTLGIMACFVQNFSGGTPPIWNVRLIVDGGQEMIIGGGSFSVCPTINWSKNYGAGGSHTFSLQYTAETQGHVDDGAVFALGTFR